MFCVKCGSQIAENSKFCPVCGNAIEMQPMAPAQPAAPAQPVQQNAATPFTDPFAADPFAQQAQPDPNAARQAQPDPFVQQAQADPFGAQPQQGVYQPAPAPVPVPTPAPEAPVYRVEDDEAEFTSKQQKIIIRTMAVISYLGVYLFFPMFVFKDKPWVRHHVNNGLVLLIFTAGFSLFSMIPFVGWVLGPIALVFLTVLMVMGIVKSIKGQMFNMPMFFGKIKILK